LQNAYVVEYLAVDFRSSIIRTGMLVSPTLNDHQIQHIQYLCIVKISSGVKMPFEKGYAMVMLWGRAADTENDETIMGGAGLGGEFDPFLGLNRCIIDPDFASLRSRELRYCI